MKKIWITVLKLLFFTGLGVFFIWLFMHNLGPDDKKEIFSSFKRANYTWIILSLFLGILSHISRTLRWMILMEPLGYKVRFHNAFFSVLIGYFANLALPRMGEITRCSLLARYEKIPLQKSFGTVVTERGIDFFTLVFLFILNIFIQIDKFNLFKETAVFRNSVDKYNKLENLSILQISLVVLFIILLFVLYKLRKHIFHNKLYVKIREIIYGFIDGFRSVLKIKKLGWFIFHSVFIWIMYLLMTWLVFFSLPQTSGLGLDSGLTILVFGTIGIVVVQGGIGIYPYIVAQTLTLFAIPQATGYAMGWLLWTGQTVMIILAGLISLILLPLYNKKRHEKD